MPGDPYSDPVTGVLCNKLELSTIAKGAMFCLPQYIDSPGAIIFRELHDEVACAACDAFVGRLAC